MKEARYQIIPISREFMLAFFTMRGPVRLHMPALPADAEFEGFDYDSMRGLIMVRVYSRDFPVVPIGEQIPVYMASVMGIVPATGVITRPYLITHNDGDEEHWYVSLRGEEASLDDCIEVPKMAALRLRREWEMMNFDQITSWVLRKVILHMNKRIHDSLVNVFDVLTKMVNKQKGNGADEDDTIPPFDQDRHIREERDAFGLPDRFAVSNSQPFGS